MRRFVSLCVLVLLGLSGLPAHAEDYVDMSDLVIYYRPEHTSYRPERIDATGRDTRESFVIVCTISRAGHLTDCALEDDTVTDPGFVRAAIRNIEDWVVADHTRSGEPTAGRQVRISAQFDLAA